MKVLSPIIISLASIIPCASSSASNLRKNSNRNLATDTYIFNTVADGAAQGTGDKVGKDCSTDARRVLFVADAEQDYMNIITSKWHSGGYRMDCVDKGAHTGWACAATCSPYPNPNFMEWGYLTFEAKVLNKDALDTGCEPRVKVRKRWPSYSSNDIVMEGGYIDGGTLVETEWKRVVIPISDFATTEWPTVNGVKDLYFLNCGTGYAVNPQYLVRGILLTDSPPSISAGEITPAPTSSPSDSPTTSEPTLYPSNNPTSYPTEAYWPIWENESDSYTPEDSSTTCFEQKDRLNIAVTENEFQTYFSVRPDAWVSGGLKFGCQDKDSNYVCIKSCFPFDGTSPDWSDKVYLTFLAKIEGESSGCKPAVSVTGGGWPRKSSNKIYLEREYADAGSLSSTEFRRVAIPLEDMKTDEWNLSNLYGMYFQTCGKREDGSAYPLLTYHISSLAVTNNVVEVVSMPPTTSPTVFVPNDILLATHRFIHTNWYPLFSPDREPAGNTWHVATNNVWPNLDANISHYTATVHIPQDQSVVYSGSDDIKLDKVIVEGSLVIEPLDTDVKLTVGTIVVEKGGSLEISTSEANSHTVTIEIDGALDHSIDPEEIMLGVLALEGNLTVSGNAATSKMAPLAQTVMAGSITMEIDGPFDFLVGGEFVLPDTQEGLNVGHWNFPNNDNYSDQTEYCIITSINGSLITCEAPFVYDHSAGFHVAYVTRSIIFKTSPESVDRGHILHTAGAEGKFEVHNARIENFGRTVTDVINNTVMSPDSALKFEPNVAKMNVLHQGTNQVARYALHAHHSLVEAQFMGNAILHSPRDGLTAHNSRVIVDNNVIVDCDGTGIFLEDATETGPVTNNYIIGTGGGSRGHDDGRFSSKLGLDMAHGGFGIWARGKLALIQGNRAEGHFGVAPYAFFVHPNFIKDKRVPDIPGTPVELVGKKLKDIHPTTTNGLQLQSYGGFVDNSAVGTFKVGIDLSYFGGDSTNVGSIIEGANIKHLALSGRGISTTHSSVFTLDDVTIEGTVASNTITGIWCNNCNGCTLQTPNTTLVVDHVETIRGGNC